MSPGCAHSYAEVMARRLQAMGVSGYDNGFALSLLPHRLQEPLKRRTPTVYFVNSMSDLLHEEIPDDFIRQVSDVTRRATQHIFQGLTKRARKQIGHQWEAPSGGQCLFLMAVAMDDRGRKVEQQVADKIAGMN